MKHLSMQRQQQLKTIYNRLKWNKMIRKKSSRRLAVTYGFPTGIIINEHQN